MDWCLRGEPKEYYMALVRCGAKMAGLGKAGAFGDTTHLRPGLGDAPGVRGYSQANLKLVLVYSPPDNW